MYQYPSSGRRFGSVERPPRIMRSLPVAADCGSKAVWRQGTDGLSMDDMPRAITLHSCTFWCSRAAVDWYTGKESLDQNCTAGRWHCAYRHERSIASSIITSFHSLGPFIYHHSSKNTNVLKLDRLFVYGPERKWLFCDMAWDRYVTILDWLTYILHGVEFSWEANWFCS